MVFSFMDLRNMDLWSRDYGVCSMDYVVCMDYGIYASIDYGV